MFHSIEKRVQQLSAPHSDPLRHRNCLRRRAAAAERFRRNGRARGVPARQATAPGAEEDRRGTGGRDRGPFRASRRWKWRATATSISGSTAAPIGTRAAARRRRRRIASAGGKIIVEHTNINPNKAAHIGHLRNAVLGDTFVRMLRARGHRVEVQNYIDNTGVQVADVVVGFHYLEKKTPADVQALIADPAVRFDYYCWDLYARTSQLLQGPSRSARSGARETLHAIEAGRRRSRGAGAPGGRRHRAGAPRDHAAARTSSTTCCRARARSCTCKFWATAFELLKERKAIYFETEGKNDGCWVMPARPSPRSDEEDSKVIVRSNGTVTYVGKDIAYQLWKFGLLGKDFYYRPLHDLPDGHVAVGHDRRAAADAAPAVRPRHAGLQRDRRAPVVPAGRGGGGTARARVTTSRPTSPSTSPTRWWRCRRAAAPSSGIPLSEEDTQAAVRRSLRPQGTRREGRRPDGQADREGARRSRLRGIRKRRRKSAARWPRRSRSARCATSC